MVVDPNCLSAAGQAIDFCGFTVLAFEWRKAIAQTREAGIAQGLRNMITPWSAEDHEVETAKPGIIAKVDRELKPRRVWFRIGFALVLIGFAFQFAGSMAAYF